MNFLNSNTKNSKKSFTLAEVLITLGIIGVIATMTITVLVPKIQDMQFKEAAKEALSKANQAVQQMKIDNGGDLSGYYGNTNSFEPVFVKYFKVAQDCGLNACITNTSTSTVYKTLLGEPANTTMGGGGQFVTTDGVFYNIYNGTWNNAITIMVDVNGYTKGPNMYGRDIFFFQLVNDVFVPAGSQNCVAPYTSASSYCNKTQHNDVQGTTCMEYVMEGKDY